jgi:hypothetical protein
MRINEISSSYAQMEPPLNTIVGETEDFMRLSILSRVNGVLSEIGFALTEF